MFEIIIDNSLWNERNLYFEQQDDIGEAIAKGFDFPSNDLKLQWNEEVISLSTPCDINDILGCLIYEMFEPLKNNSKDFRVVSPSNSFMAIWDFHLVGVNYHIRPTWIDVRYEIMKDKESILVIEKKEFLKVWHEYFFKVVKHLRNCGYTNDNYINDFWNCIWVKHMNH